MEHPTDRTESSEADQRDSNVQSHPARVGRPRRLRILSTLKPVCHDAFPHRKDVGEGVVYVPTTTGG